MTALREGESVAGSGLPQKPRPLNGSSSRPSERVTNTELLEALGVAVYMTDAAGVITEYNEAAAELWGRRPVVGQDMWCGSWRLYWPDGTPMAHGECPMALTLTQGRSVRGYEAIAERPDGSRVRFVPYPTPLRDGAGRLVGAVNVLVDITDRKLAEQGAQVIAERLRRAQQAAKIGTFDWNIPKNELIWDGVEEVHGREPGSFEGTFEAYQADIHPEDKDRVTSALYAAVEEASGLDIEYRIVCPDGSVKWVNGKSRVFTDESGKAVHVTGTCQDVSERKASTDERERLLQELTVANAAKDDFLGMVSHELKTPITTILGNAEVLTRRSALLEEGMREEAMHDILAESQRLQTLIDNLLALSRIGGGRLVEAEPILIARQIEKLIARHQSRHPNRAYTVSSSEPGLTALADVDSLDQVMTNLVTNAEKYSSSQSPIEVEISSDESSVLVTVADRGSGVRLDECDQIFNAFYRSKSTAGQATGTGVGLAVCRRLVEAQGGEILASPRPGGGSLFRFTVPIVDRDDPAVH